jgi:hypothetical protein
VTFADEYILGVIDDLEKALMRLKTCTENFGLDPQNDLDKAASCIFQIREYILRQ